MTKRHSITLIPAAGYLRRSTAKQEKSLEDQRREIERYAAQHGYHIVRWYQDDAISGDDTEKRLGFQQMHRDACSGGGFEVILCWDQDRFGRFSPQEASYWTYPLSKAGVRLVTVAEGPVDWDDFIEWLSYSVKQHGKHQFLVDLSRNTARGQITAVLNGWLTGRAAPYGYDRMLVDEAGNHKLRVHNGEQVAKPRSWHVTLVVSDDPEKVKVAEWVFQTYADNDVGLRWLANDLNKRGIPGPRGRLWHVGTIREMLKNETYAGDFIWPKRSMGKYHRISGTEIKPRSGKLEVRCNEAAEQIQHRGSLPALVERETWERVQVKLAQRRERTTPHKAKNMDKYILSGLVFCEHCGAKMYGQRSSRRKNGKTYTYERYVCSTYHTKGHQVCGHHTIDQAALLAVLLRKLQEEVLIGEHRRELRQRILEGLAAEQSAPTDIDALRRRVADFDKQVAHGTKRLLQAPDDIADLLAAELSKLRKERDRLARELSEWEPTPVTDLEAKADALVDRLWRLRKELENAPSTRMRELVHQMVTRIDLRFDRKKQGRRTIYPFAGGIVHLRPDPVLYRLVNRGDWI